MPGVLLGPLLWPVRPPGRRLRRRDRSVRHCQRWHLDDLRHGADRAKDARDRRTPLDAGRERFERRGVRGGRWIDRRGLAGRARQRGRTVRIPVCPGSGRRTLEVGATGSGKTVTQTWIAAAYPRRPRRGGDGDPKGDRRLHNDLEVAARKARRTFRVWTPDGPGVYNAIAHSTDTDLADTSASR